MCHRNAPYLVRLGRDEFSLMEIERIEAESVYSS